MCLELLCTKTFDRLNKVILSLSLSLSFDAWRSRLNILVIRFKTIPCKTIPLSKVLQFFLSC